MWGLLASAGRSLLKNVLPSAINWGINKLTQSNFGKQVLTPSLMQKVQGVVTQTNQALNSHTQQSATPLPPLNGTTALMRVANSVVNPPLNDSLQPAFAVQQQQFVDDEPPVRSRRTKRKGIRRRLK